MIRTKDELKRYIEYETRNFDHPILLKIPVDLYESQIIARYLILLRKTEYHINCGHKIRKIFYLLRLKRKQCRYGIHIPVNVFDKGLSIAHLGTIVVNGNAKIGKDCRIHVGVVIGANGENVRGFGLICTWLMPSTSFSTGSSIVTTFTFGVEGWWRTA